MSIADSATYDIASAMIGSGDVGQEVIYENVTISVIFQPTTDDEQDSGKTRQADQAFLIVMDADVSEPKYNDQVEINNEAWKVIRKSGNQVTGYHRLLIKRDQRRLI